MTVLMAAAFSGTACDEIESLAPPDDAPHADLSITTSVNPTSAAIGAQVVVTLRVRNNGPIAATGIVVGDTAHAGMTFVSHTVTAGSYSTGSRRWSIATLAADAEEVLSLTLAVASGTVGAPLQIRAGVLSTDMNDSLLTNNIASANVTVIAGTPPPPPPPPPAGVTFTSSWGTATGTSQSAFTDGGRWDNAYCGSASQTATIVAGGPVGWTKTANVLRLQQLGSSICGTLEKELAVPVSTTHWGRFYFRNDETATTHNHVVTYNPGVGAPIQVALWNRRGSTQGVNIFMRTYYRAGGQPTSYPQDIWSMGTIGQGGLDRLQNGVWYRYEWMMEYVTPTSYRIWPRIYNMAGTLLYDAARFVQNDYTGGAGQHTLATWYAAGNAFGFTDVSLARRLGLGNEGPATSSSTGGYWYHADVALSTSGWIGQ